jgi:nickel transport protein
MIRRLLIALVVMLACASPATAHKLKLFAAIEGNTIAGYAFFIGGGRAQDTPWRAKDESGKLLGEGRTGPEGEFRLTVPEPIASDITITVDTKEGHMASKTLEAARFGVAEPATAPAPAPEASVTAPAAAFGDPASSVAAAPDVAALVEAAVQRQVTPLLERIEEMDSRLRYADIMSGIFLIVGLAGIGLWARGRHK